MAAVGIESAPGLQQLFKDISPKFKAVESESIVKTLKKNYGGKFDLLDSHDLMKCFQLLEKHGYVSDNKLNLIEDFVATKSDEEKLIKKDIDRFKDSLLGKGDPEKELQGRSEEIKKINKKLESKDTVVLNLFGSSGVGKTKLATEVCSQWRGTHRVFDLREAKNMTAIYYKILHSLELVVPVGHVDQNYVVTKVLEKVEEFKDKEHAVLFMLDNVDHFTAGKGKEGKNLKTAFMEFLAKLSEKRSKEERSPLKLLLTSKTELRGSKRMDDFEVRSLERTYSEKLIFPKGIIDVKPQQKDNLMSITKGFPLFLKGLGAILRQERKSPEELTSEVVRALKKLKVEQDAGGKLAGFEEEGVDVNQMFAVSLMFETLSTERLKLSAVVVSLFHGPFSVATAAKVLDIDPSEAIVQLEGLVASEIISVVNEEAKERKYDIHPLLRKYADSIKNNEDFLAPYLEAKARFYEFFMSRMKKIAELIEPNYVNAFNLFETDRGNYEFTVEISLQPEYFIVPGEFHENALIASLFIAMLTDNQLIKVFHSWAEMCEDDGKTGERHLNFSCYIKIVQNSYLVSYLCLSRHLRSFSEVAYM